MKRFILIIILMSIFSAVSVSAGLNKKTVNSTIQDFNQTARAVRQEFLEYPNYSLKLDDVDHASMIPAALRRLAIAGEKFTIRKVNAKYDHFKVEFETPGKRRLHVTVYDRGELTQSFLDAGLRRLLSDIFVFGPSPTPVSFAGNRESKLVHLDRCNHLPPPDLRQSFQSRGDAAAAGYRDCPICFGNTVSLPYPGYLADRTAGLQSAKAFELVYPVSPDTALQRRLDRLGQTVLDQWPLELSGFEYDFRVVQADQPLAASFSTGIVVVSDTMLEAAEADEEILFVLAHEVAHCEMQLPPRSPFAGERPYPLDKGYDAYFTWLTTQQLAADLVAVSWFQSQEGERWKLSRARSALAKVQQAVGAVEDLTSETGEYYTLHERLWLFEPERFQPGDIRRVFVAEDVEGDVRYEIRFLGLMEREKGVMPCLLLTTTDYQEKPDYGQQGSRGEFTDSAGRSFGFEAESWAAVPGCTTLIIGKTKRGETMESYTPGLVDKVMLYQLDGAKMWNCDGVQYSRQVSDSDEAR